ncbi:MAG: CehA/McbA family metallohydrolase [Bryobacterales bacterium]|nr:CehA/McbA family metallohydrolase [Bryobacterales bacterium]
MLQRQPAGLFGAAILAAIAAAALPAAAAELMRIGPEHRWLLPGGKEVDAIDGDYLLRSDKIAATIGGTAAFRDANVNTQCVQGAVLDLVRRDLPGASNDLLSAFYPHGHFLDAPAPTRAEIVKESGPEVVIRFYRSAKEGPQGDPVDVMTEYTLRDGEPFLRIKTTYSNPSSKVANAAIYDKIRADTLFRIPPAGTGDSLIYYEPWNRAAYGVVRAGGAPIRSYANPANKTYNQDGGNRLDFPELLTKDTGERPLGEALPLPSPIPPGGSATIERFLIPGRHPADVQSAIASILGRAATPVRIRVTDEGQKPVGGASVVALRGQSVLSEGWTDAEGRLTLILGEPGSCEIVVTERGRAEVRARWNADAAAPETKIVAGPSAQAAFDVVDTTRGRARGPVKVVLRGRDGTPDPNLGPDSLAYQAGNLCFSRDGRFTVALPPGRYEALIGRGPEFTQETRRFDVAYGRTTPVTAEIRRAFESPGWVIADLHNHTTMSNDSIAEPHGRVVGIAAAGIEFAQATEHNRIATLAPYIEREKLTAFLQSAGSMELSGRPGPGGINHQTAFPLRVQDGAQSGGAPRTDKDPAVQIRRLSEYDDGAEKYVQHNHPDIAWLYYDRGRNGKIDGGFGTRPYTHAIEINRDIANLLKYLDPEKKAARRGPAFYWLQMLNQGDRIFAVANSDAHITAYNNGSIFTYIKSDTDDPARLNALALARAAKTGQMVPSNGPFLEVSLNGVLPGGELRVSGAATLNVRVQCAGWIDIDRIQVLVNGRPDPALNFTRAASSEGFRSGNGPLRFERRIPLALSGDAHVIVIAAGESSRIGPFHGGHASQPPTALSNPIQPRITMETSGDPKTP